jgi:ABC-type nitrate/sulfonate/bicarbonate transport system permease component
MMTHYALTQAALVAQDIEAKGFLGTVGKIAAATIIFFVGVGFVVGLILGIFIGKAMGRRKAEQAVHHMNDD